MAPGTSIRRKFTGVFYRAALASLLALAAGCSTVGTSHSKSAAMASAPLPTYVKGERFITSDGISLRVESVSGNEVEWRYKRHVHLKESRDFIYSTLERKSRTSTTTRDYSPLNHQALFPLRVGNSAKFTETTLKVSQKSGTKRGKPRYWICEVDGTEKLDLMAGTFDTFRVVCERVHRRHNYKNVVHTYYYAPAVGHVVLKTIAQKYNKRPDKRIELIGARPSLAAMGVDAETRQRAYAAFQKVLDGAASGATSVWRDPKSGAEVRTVVNGTYQRKDGSYCRRYLQEVTPNLGHRVYPGIACRGEDGHWSAPSH